MTNIADIKAKLRLSDIISREVELKPSGRDCYRAYCPIHGSDKQRSLSIDDAQGLWKCFACGAAGDVINWVEIRKGVTRGEAIALCAEEAGVEVNESPASQHRREVQALVAEAADYYHSRLPDRVREVVLERWGITSETIDAQKIGWCDATWKPKANDETRLATGLFKEKNGKLYEPLKGRLTLCWTSHGKPCYIVGRTLADDVEPKYLNQTATKACPKPLWGRDSLVGADAIIIVEGIFDALAVLQAAQELKRMWSVLALAGSKLRPEDADTIAKSNPPEIYLVLDVDGAGVTGTIESARLLIERGVQDIFVVQLQPDPAEYLLTHSSADFAKEVSKVSDDGAFRNDIWQFWATELSQLTEARRNQALSAELLPTIAKLDKLHKEQALATIQDEVGSSLAVLKQQAGETIVTDDQWGALRDWFRHAFFVIGHEQDDKGTSLMCWNRTTRKPIALRLDRPQGIKATLAPFVGNIGNILALKLPGVTKASERFSLFMGVLYDMARETQTLDDFVRLRNGLHATTEGVFLLSRRRVLRYTDKWQPVEEPAIGEYLLETSPKVADWLEFSIEELSAPLTIEPLEAYNLLEDALIYGWTWPHPEDVQIIALSCFALTWGTVFASKPWLHIIGPAESGKSALGMGFMAGKGELYAPMGGPFVPTAGAEEDASVAGVVGKYAYAGQAIIVDEADPMSRPIAELLDIMRNSGTSGAGQLRGTPEGGFREKYLYLPAVFIGTEPWVRDPDITRWLDIPLYNDKERDSRPPEMELYRFWRDKGIEPRELRRTILLSFLHNWEELRAAYAELRERPPNDEDYMTARMKNNLLPQLACAQVLGLDVAEIEGTLSATRREYKRGVTADRIELRLRDILISGSFITGGGRTTISQIAGSAESDVMASPTATAPLGVALVFDQHHHIKKLYVNWAAAQQQGPLYGTPFRHEQYTSPRYLNSIAQNIPGFIQASQPKTVGGVNARWTSFDYEEMTADMEKPQEKLEV